MSRNLLSILLLAACAILAQPALADMPSSTYDAVAVQARVVDRLGKPVAGLPLQMEVSLQGVARHDDGWSEGIQTSETRTVRTDTQGVALLQISGLPWTHEKRWFRGRISLTASLIFQKSREISLLGAYTISTTEDIPTTETVPFTYGWTLPANPQDHASGSLLPTFYVDRFTTVYPLGLAGATLRSDPTFIPTDSALDAGPDETPPFDAWYARPDNAPAIPHDTVGPDEAIFVVQQLLGSDWAALPNQKTHGQTNVGMLKSEVKSGKMCV